jgi:hypothetical protein
MNDMFAREIVIDFSTFWRFNMAMENPEMYTEGVVHWSIASVISTKNHGENCMFDGEISLVVVVFSL